MWSPSGVAEVIMSVMPEPAPGSLMPMAKL
jgi:hypothetical protein